MSVLLKLTGECREPAERMLKDLTLYVDGVKALVVENEGPIVTVKPDKGKASYHSLGFVDSTRYNLKFKEDYLEISDAVGAFGCNLRFRLHTS